jgi:hypothetical protein
VRLIDSGERKKHKEEEKNENKDNPKSMLLSPENALEKILNLQSREKLSLETRSSISDPQSTRHSYHDEFFRI